MKLRKNNIITFIITLIILNSLFMCTSKVLAAEEETNIKLSDSGITVEESKISTDIEDSVYLTKSMNNGGNSQEAQEANIQIENIVNINSSGTYKFTGSLSDGQISINAQKIVGQVTIILNNVDITCKNAPAIFVYNTTTNSSNCTITIKTENGTTNTITGGKIKQSVEGWEGQDKINYYIDKGYDDDRSYYERYKYDGAISSDISLTFEGEGTLTVNSSEKEGIESKGNITINNGKYIVNSLDDGINACTDKESIITINGGTILVNILGEAEEGDGIDSNGYIYINGGNIYSFASETSQDNGLDSDLGTYINGGNVVSTGNMSDDIENDSKQGFITLQFANTIEKGTLIAILDKDENPIVAFEADRNYRILTLSTPKIENSNYYVYEGGKINGTSENGLYTEITSYTKGTQQKNNESELFNITETNHSFRDVSKEGTNKTQNLNYYYLLLGLVIILIIFIILVVVLKKKIKFDIKSTIIILIIGILIGSIITTISFMIYHKANAQENIEPNMMNEPMQNNGQGMKNNPKQDNEEKPVGEPSEMQNNNEPPEKPNTNI